MSYWFDAAQDIQRLSQNRFQVTVWYGLARGGDSQAITFIFPADVPNWRIDQLLVQLAQERHRGDW